MATWTLILVFWGNSLTSTTVTGFTSAATCEAAIAQLKVGYTGRRIDVASCVEVK